MSQSPRLTNIAKLGIGLAIASPVPWLLLLVLPFLPLSVAGRAIAAGGLLVVAEAMFWVGVMLAGQEVVRRYRRRLGLKALWGRISRLLRSSK
jgi:hypothetical protein